MNADEVVPEIVELRFTPKPWWLTPDTTAKTILVATFEDGKQAWVSWRFVAPRERGTAENMWHYLMWQLMTSEETLKHIYLRDIRKVPRFQRVKQYPVTGID